MKKTASSVTSSRESGLHYIPRASHWKTAGFPSRRMSGASRYIHFIHDDTEKEKRLAMVPVRQHRLVRSSVYWLTLSKVYHIINRQSFNLEG